MQKHYSHYSMFTKLFYRILDSSIWLEPHATRIVWVTLLAAMDEDGYAHFSTVENLASRARVTLEECENALKCFLSPDTKSPHQEHEGRRVERVPGGFMILNAPKYRALARREQSLQQNRLRVAKFREKHTEEIPPSGPPSEKCNAPVMHPPLHPASASVHECTSEKDKGCGEKEERNFVTDVRNLGDRLGALFGREVGSFLGYCEETGLYDLLKRPKIKSEVKEIVGWFAKSPRYKPQSLCSLLERWDSSLDRARNYDKNLKDNAENKPPSKTMSDRMMDDITRVSKL